MIYFISGHRDLSYKDFEKYYVPVLIDILSYESYPVFVVGDCDGVDKFAMDYIYNHACCAELHIYHMFETPRNTPNKYDTYYFDDNLELEDNDSIEVTFIGGFKSDEERDSAMTKNSDCDIAFIKDNRWNSGTAQNIKRRHEISNNLFNSPDNISDFKDN